jgi:hypothetical protein
VFCFFVGGKHFFQFSICYRLFHNFVKDGKKIGVSKVGGKEKKGGNSKKVDK